MPLNKCTIALPTGELTLILDAGTIILCEFSDREARIDAHLSRHYGGQEITVIAAPEVVKKAFEAYAGGDYEAMVSLKCAPKGTPYQRKVWQALKRIPAGTTLSYKAFADMVGTGARAVGTANGRNPICLMFPCHRVIGGDGDLRGYAGGLERKQWLLEHEGALL